MARPLELSRDLIVSHRRGVNGLDERLGFGPEALRRAAWAGLTDSMPRAALFSIHARVLDTPPDAWEHEALVQVWGPRFSVYVVAERDRAVFTLGRHPVAGAGHERAETLARELRDALAGGTVQQSDAARVLGGHPNRLRYATTTGELAIRWDGARQPSLTMRARPEMDAAEAKLELARRFLHVLGPGTAESFAQWAGVKPRAAAVTFRALADETVQVHTPVGDGVILAADEEWFRSRPSDPAPVRLLPSGDAFFLMWGRDRELLVPDAARRDELWTSRVWPGALVVGGEVAGVWRRQQGRVTIHPWRRFTAAEGAAIEEEAVSLPVPDVDGVSVRWEGP